MNYLLPDVSKKEKALLKFLQDILQDCSVWPEFVLKYEMKTGAEVDENTLSYVLKHILANMSFLIYQISYQPDALSQFKKYMEMTKHASDRLSRCKAVEVFRVFYGMKKPIGRLITELKGVPDQGIQDSLVEIRQWFIDMLTILAKRNLDGVTREKKLLDAMEKYSL